MFTLRRVPEPWAALLPAVASYRLRRGWQKGSGPAAINTVPVSSTAICRIIASNCGAQALLQAYPVFTAIVAAVQGRVRALAPAGGRTRRGGGVEPAWLLLRRHQWHRIAVLQAHA